MSICACIDKITESCGLPSLVNLPYFREKLKEFDDEHAGHGNDVYITQVVSPFYLPEKLLRIEIICLAAGLDYDFLCTHNNPNTPEEKKKFILFDCNDPFYQEIVFSRSYKSDFDGIREIV